MRICCFIHMVELPARKLMEVLIGERSGPFSRRGEVGLLLSQPLEKMPVVNFVAVPNDEFPQVKNHSVYTKKAFDFLENK